VATKFEEMRESVSQAVKKWEEYHHQCIKDLHLLVQGFVAYSEIPRDKIYFLRVDEDPEEGKKYGMVGAMHWGPDGFWHLGLAVELHPFKTILIELCVDNNKGKLFVKAGKDGRVRELDLANKDRCDEFYESIVEKVKQFFTTRLEETLDRQSPVKIGFL
jgi:hypothetical protein